MKVAASNPFLPRVTSCPRVVMITAVARALEGPYSALLEEGLPPALLAVVQRMDAAETKG
jgi:hypothetical protein